MEWKKECIDKAEFERMQREYIEKALSMQKNAGCAVSCPPTSCETVSCEVEEKPVKPDGLCDNDETFFEAAEEEPAGGGDCFAGFDGDFAAEASEDAAEEAADCGEVKYGVYNAEELSKADLSGEGLKKASEILEEMTRQTEAMKKLVSEKECDGCTFPETGEDADE